MYNKASLNLKDIKNKIRCEIFGREYNVSVTRKYLDELERLKAEEVEDEVIMKNTLDKILGDGEYDKLKEIYEKEENEEFDDIVWYNVVLFLAKQIRHYFDNIDRKEQYQNREYRRKNKNNYRRY